MHNKRVTIYELAEKLGISASYVSRALNNHASVNPRMIALVKNKAIELNYRHNSQAANLRQGSSKTVGVIVPHINQNFFSEAIAGIEEVCFANNHRLFICQSHDSYEQECKAIDSLIHQNVNCIIISVSAQTQSEEYLYEIQRNNITLIQFDRIIDAVDSYKVMNNNVEAAYNAVKDLFKQGYKRIAFMGGPAHMSIYTDRKKGFLNAIKEEGLTLPASMIADNVLEKALAVKACGKMLALKDPPDAFFTVSDHQSLAVLQTIRSLGYRVPEDIGIFGFANEAFTELTLPALSSVDQKSKQLGKLAADLYFDSILQNDFSDIQALKSIIVRCDIITRQSSKRM